MLLLLGEGVAEATAGVEFQGWVPGLRLAGGHAGLGVALDGDVSTVAEHHSLGFELLCRGHERVLDLVNYMIQ